MRNIYYMILKVEDNKEKIMAIKTRLKNITPLKDYFEHYKIYCCNNEKFSLVEEH